jgi:hypothetical protein
MSDLNKASDGLDGEHLKRETYRFYWSGNKGERYPRVVPPFTRTPNARNHIDMVVVPGKYL